MVERFHGSPNTSLSHNIDSANTNWDVTPFYIMSYCATPQTTTGFSPYYLLYGREMALPNSDNLKAKFWKENFDQDCRLENLKSSLRLAYKAVKKANRQSHLNNKLLYDRKAKLRSFQSWDIVYLYNPTRTSEKCFKFYKFWAGPLRLIPNYQTWNMK